MKSTGPLGVRLLNKIPWLNNLSLETKIYCHQFNVLLLTFLSYAAFHMARKPTSVAKNALHRDNCTGLEPPEDYNASLPDAESWCSWKPFDGDNADTLLGAVDSSFLFAYALGMYLTGSLAERANLQYFLPIGMILSGIFSLLFGVAHWAGIHSIYYFIAIQIVAGVSQSTGWPSCVTAVGNWLGKGKRGLIMGIWRANHSVGNIFGTLLASAFVEVDWGLSFAVPSAIIIFLGIFTFFFLVPDPRNIGFPRPDHGEKTKEEEEIDSSKSEEKEKAISFTRALLIPGVIEFSLCLFFTKMINYTFLYWLPRFIKESGLGLNDADSGNLSTLFDFGGIIGGITSGLLSDWTGMSAITCGVALFLSLPLLFVYQAFGSSSVAANIAILFVLGFVVNGPYALITTAVSADLGTHPQLRGSSKALATVTAIIDGTGSIGAAVGPLLAGSLSSLGWDYVFYAMMIASGVAFILLGRLMYNEVMGTCRARTQTETV